MGSGFQFLLIFIFAARLVLGEQLFTSGLGIIDAPSAGSPAHAGSGLPIAIEVSGNGQLSTDSAIDSIQIYLVSSQTGLNLTVESSGAKFLASESGSVRHLSWQVPNCVSPGQYNLTFYENSRFEGQPLFAITSITIPVENPKFSGECTEGVNPLQPQPQVSSGLAESPFLKKTGATTASSSGFKTSIGPTLLTITLPGGFDLPTVTQTIVNPTTLVVKEVVTTTVNGEASVVTAIRTTTVVPAAQTDNSGFIPVNAAFPTEVPRSLRLWFSLVCSVLIFEVI